MKSGCSGALKPDRLGLTYKANKCSDTGTGDFGVQTTHESSPRLSLGDAGSSKNKTDGVKKLLFEGCNLLVRSFPTLIVLGHDLGGTKVNLSDWSLRGIDMQSIIKWNA